MLIRETELMYHLCKTWQSDWKIIKSITIRSHTLKKCDANVHPMPLHLTGIENDYMVYFINFCHKAHRPPYATQFPLDAMVMRKQQLETVWWKGVVWISLSFIGVEKRQTHFGVHCWTQDSFHPQNRLCGSALRQTSSLLCSLSSLFSWTGKASVQVVSRTMQ